MKDLRLMGYKELSMSLWLKAKLEGVEILVKDGESLSIAIVNERYEAIVCHRSVVVRPKIENEE